MSETIIVAIIAGLPGLFSLIVSVRAQDQSARKDTFDQYQKAQAATLANLQSEIQRLYTRVEELEKKNRAQEQENCELEAQIAAHEKTIEEQREQIGEQRVTIALLQAQLVESNLRIEWLKKVMAQNNIAIPPMPDDIFTAQDAVLKEPPSAGGHSRTN